MHNGSINFELIQSEYVPFHVHVFLPSLAVRTSRALRSSVSASWWANLSVCLFNNKPKHNEYLLLWQVAQPL